MKPLVPKDAAMSAHSFPALPAWPKTWCTEMKILFLARNKRSLHLFAKLILLLARATPRSISCSVLGIVQDAHSSARAITPLAHRTDSAKPVNSAVLLLHILAPKINRVSLDHKMTRPHKIWIALSGDTAAMLHRTTSVGQRCVKKLPSGKSRQWTQFPSSKQTRDT